MSQYTDHALAQLKAKGFRITKPRRLVVELLDSTPRALSAYEIKDMLDTVGEKVDTVSVYRILDCLEETHLIHRVLQTGKVLKCALEPEDHCARHQHDHCHHLLICQKCHRIEEAHCPGVDDMITELEASARFRIHSHNLEFFGLCQQCQ